MIIVSNLESMGLASLFGALSSIPPPLSFDSGKNVSSSFG